MLWMLTALRHYMTPYTEMTLVSSKSCCTVELSQTSPLLLGGYKGVLRAISLGSFILHVFRGQLFRHWPTSHRIGVGTHTWSVSKCSRSDHSEFFVPVSRLQTLNLLYCYRQLTVCVVVSAIAVFRLVDNLMPGRLQIVLWLNYKPKLFANSDRDTGTTGLLVHWPLPTLTTIYIHPWQSSAAHWLLFKSRPVHDLILSSYPFFCLPLFLVPCLVRYNATSPTSYTSICWWPWFLNRIYIAQCCFDVPLSLGFMMVLVQWKFSVLYFFQR